MNNIIEFIIGLLGGTFFGVTGILPIGTILIMFEYLGIGTYTSNLGAISMLNLFPISIGTFWNFYKNKNINYSMGFILLSSIIIGAYFGSLLVVDKHYKLSHKTIKYITSFLGFFIGITFLISAQSE